MKEHGDAINVFARNPDVSIWQDSSCNNISKLQVAIENIVLPAKHHGQQVEQSVQDIDICSQNLRSIKTSTALTTSRSYIHQAVRIQHENMLEKQVIPANQHMTKGTNAPGMRQSVSTQSIYRSQELLKNGQKRGTKSQASKSKAQLFIENAQNDLFPESKELYKKLVSNSMKRKKELDGYVNAKFCRIRQTYLSNE